MCIIVVLIGDGWIIMKNKLLKILLVINGLVGLSILWAVGSGVYQTITIPNNFDYFSASLFIASGVPCLIANVIIHLIIRKFLKK